METKMNLDQYGESPVVPEGSRDLGQAVDIRARDGDGAVFSRVVRARHSVRQFKPNPVPLDVMRSVLADARFSPSNCNTQPWEVHVLSGKIRDAFSARMIVSADRGENSLDYSWAKTDYPDQCVQRYDEHGRIRHEAIGLVREDAEGRRWNDRRNLTLFDAPHVALLFMPAVGDSVRVAGDIGMYAQTFLLSLTAHGLGGIPQTTLGFYADEARELLGVAKDMRLLFGIAFGYEDDDSIYNSYRMDRVSVGQTVVFHEAPDGMA